MFEVFNTKTGCTIALFFDEVDARDYLALCQESNITWYDYDEVWETDSAVVRKILKGAAHGA